MSNKYILLNSENEIVNIILWDGLTDYAPSEGLSIEVAPTVESKIVFDIGMYKQEDGLFYYKWSDGTFNLQKELPVVEQPQ